MQTAIARAEPVVVSGLAYPELSALTQRQHRDHVGRLRTSQVSALLEQFREDWDTLYVVPVDEALLLEASVLVIRQAAFGLRAMDTIHVASALLAAEAFEGLRFLTFDTRQQQAALAEGLALFPEG
ncbi:type II toxin-antitoxin system VapC family toxin [Deinococcus sp. QL22]|uniref:type II toxin-antitoxin system VapC family toxin n=1 Tax=Deinococcus sp. QL22 TaxID=2939437 RepID=UPI00201787FD|nr:type II toxin-antitoxin system VapC family toxin [Deinococcus sp. QL22]UQN09444.1 type II toxin-antitoxin system VapC family toxin [Deinococcus sp. QL22]